MKYILKLLYIFFVLLFIRGALEEYLGISNFLLDVCTLLLAIYIAILANIEAEAFYAPPGSGFFLLYLFWVLLSTIFTGTPLYFFITYSRIIIIVFCIYAALYNGIFTKDEIYKLLRFVFLLMVLQIFASAFELFILGKQDEFRVGLMIFGSGGYATLFPLLAMSYGFGLCYFYSHSHRQSFFYYLLAWAFLLIGYASGKRAVFLFAPVLYILSFICYCILDKQRKKIVFRRILFVVIISAVFVRIFFYILGQLGGFEVVRKGITYSQKLSLATQSAGVYTFGLKSEDAYSVGRGANLVKAWNMVIKNKYPNFWFGGGPMSTAEHRKEFMLKKYKIGYGVPGVVYEMLNIGVPGVILYMCLMLSVWFNLFKLVRFKTLNPAGKVLYFGLLVNLFTFLFIHIYYFNAFLVDIIGGIMIFPVLALLIAPQYREIFLIEDDSDETVNTEV